MKCLESTRDYLARSSKPLVLLGTGVGMLKTIVQPRLLNMLKGGIHKALRISRILTRNGPKANVDDTTIGKIGDELVDDLCDHYTSGVLDGSTKLLAPYSFFDVSVSVLKSINWHRSFFLEYEWPLDYYLSYDIYPHENIDVKYVWEINRHQFFPRLAIDAKDGK